MTIIKYTDNDELNKQKTEGSPVYAVHQSPTQESLTKEGLINRYPKVFSEGVGQLEGEYCIRLDNAVNPVQHAPCRVPVALGERLKETLENLEQQGIITPVTTPTSWVSSMVVVPKKSGKQICLDPKDLNRAIQRDHYPLPTIEDIATRLHGAKVFTVMDVRSGFWHVKLDEKSSFLTAFNTPFGRFRD